MDTPGRLALKAQDNGFVLLVPGVGPAGAPSPLPLLFHLQPCEASFHLYTDLPLALDTGLADTQLAGGCRRTTLVCPRLPRQ